MISYDESEFCVDVFSLLLVFALVSSSLLLFWVVFVGSLLLLLVLWIGVVVVSLRCDTDRRIGVVVDVGLLIDDNVDRVIRGAGGRLDILADLKGRGS